ncbi:MAG TPA: hypothetical protein VF493_18175 [Terriglobales bacterium]
MQLPEIQYGDWKTVKKRMQRVVTQLKRGADLVEVMTSDGMLDTATTPGLLMMGGINPGANVNFHCYAPWRLAWAPLGEMRSDPTVPTPLENAIFASSLGTPWGVLGLLTHDSQPWLYPTERHRPLLRAALEVWPELDAVGARYYSALQGRPLWSVPNNLHFVLAKLGVPTDVLRAPLPPGGPRGLLKYVRPVN